MLGERQLEICDSHLSYPRREEHIAELSCFMSAGLFHPCEIRRSAENAEMPRDWRLGEAALRAPAVGSCDPPLLICRGDLSTGAQHPHPRLMGPAPGLPPAGSTVERFAAQCPADRPAAENGYLPLMAPPRCEAIAFFHSQHQSSSTSAIREYRSTSPHLSHVIAFDSHERTLYLESCD